ncbi:hypothetical protein BDR07DRAFT_1377794 [Suillus spraguei]|nr:hypothetical protein BDR07DRAFT_1377794 [Suillus spraguei]
MSGEFHARQLRAFIPRPSTRLAEEQEEKGKEITEESVAEETSGERTKNTDEENTEKERLDEEKDKEERNQRSADRVKNGEDREDRVETSSNEKEDNIKGAVDLAVAEFGRLDVMTRRKTFIIVLMGAYNTVSKKYQPEDAMLSITQEFAMVHVREGICLNSICLGPLKTNCLETSEKKECQLVHLPMGRFGEAIELTQALNSDLTIAYAGASDDSGYMTYKILVVRLAGSKMSDYG